MRRKKIILWVLCAVASQTMPYTATGRFPKMSGSKKIEAAVLQKEPQNVEVLPDQPEFVVTEQPFLSFEDMEAGEERCQVFSIWNTGEEEEAYYFTIQATEGITWELAKAGTLYSSGQALQTPFKLAELPSNDHVVFQLTVKNTEKAFGTAVPVFSRDKP